MFPFTRIQGVSVAAIGGVVLALAFPRAGLAYLAPVGAAALFLTWNGTSWKRNAGLGWLCAWVFFTITFWWWSTTIVTVVGVWAYVAVLIGAAYQACYVAVAGVLAAFVAQRAHKNLAPLGVACAFAIMEWLRSIGIMGNPFAQLGTSQAATPLRALAAYIGTLGVTFVVCAIGAYAADALVRRRLRTLLAVCCAIAAATAVAWIAWPARHATQPTIPVVAVQGNITQSLKWQPGSVAIAVDRYTQMTRDAFVYRPKLVVWPETVIPIYGAGLNEDPALMSRFRTLARDGKTTIVAGSTEMLANRWYNALFFFSPAGATQIYEKRQLVPFAETFPAQRFLSWLPYIGSLQGNYSSGSGNGVAFLPGGLAVGSLICWESAFGDIAYDEVRNGANVLVVSTDDAWFGESSGPFEHAQIAQMRAIESGSYVVRAAATGISGIIAPDGTWSARSDLDTQRNVNGFVGVPTRSPFAHFGPTPVFYAIVMLYVLLCVTPKRSSRA